MKRYVISPGILREVGKEAAFVAGVMFGKTLDEFLEGESTTREVYTLGDIIIKTGLPRNPAKKVLRQMIKRQLVVEGAVKNTYRLTWDALIHMCYVRDTIIDMANDAFLDTSARWKQYVEMQTQIEQMNADSDTATKADSEHNDDDSLHGRVEGEIQAAPDADETEAEGGNVSEPEAVAPGSDEVVGSS